MPDTENTFLHLLDYSSDLFCAFSAEGEILNFNRAWEYATGHREKELKGRSLFDFFHPEDIEQARSAIFKQSGKKGISRFSARFRCKNGFYKNLEWHFYSTTEETSFALAQEYYQQRGYPSTLKNDADNFHLLFHQNPLPIFIFDLNTLDFLKVNQAAVDLYGYSREELLSLKITDIRPEEDIEKLLEDVKEIDFEKPSTGQTSRHLKKNGELLFVEINAHSVIFSGKKARIITVNNITEHWRLEEALRKTNAQKDLFFSVIAHDLRSPFNTLINFSELMVQDFWELSREEIYDYLKMMHASSLKLYEFVQNLLEWSLFQREMKQIRKKPIRLNQNLKKAVDLLQQSAAEKNISLIQEIPGDTTVFADENLLHSVLRNLISNAIKFTPKGGKVTVTGHQAPTGHFKILVKDTGIGMNKKMQNELFKPEAVTGRSGTEGEQSSGLGLILCKEFVEKMGGSIGVQSTEGKGSVFYFTVPVTDPRESNP